MSGQELMLVQLGQALSRAARPHQRDEALPAELQTRLWQLGVPCGELTPREQLVARLWARKRRLSLAAQPSWGSPGATPLNAA